MRFGVTLSESLIEAFNKPDFARILERFAKILGEVEGAPKKPEMLGTLERITSVHDAVVASKARRCLLKPDLKVWLLEENLEAQLSLFQGFLYMAATSREVYSENAYGDHHSLENDGYALSLLFLSLADEVKSARPGPGG